jgi:hypothetical protein
MWEKIPAEIMDELDALRRHTRKTGNEASFTYCKKSHKDRLHIGSDFLGDSTGTMVGDCSREYGKSSRIGDAHSHPVGSDAMGITPSDADIQGTVEDSHKHKRNQINCVTSPIADIVHCMQLKEPPTRKQLRGYSQLPKDRYKVNPYVIDNVGQDFNIGLFDRESGNRLESPDPKRVVDNAFGKSTRNLRRRTREMDRGNFCEFVQDINVPKDDRISDTCKTELKKKGILDYLGIV